MPSTNETATGLNLWVENDVPTMDDFNDDNQIITLFMETSGIHNRKFQISPDIWEETEYISFPYQAVISNWEIKNTDDVMVMFDMRSIFTAKNIGITNGIGETVDGGVRVLAVSKPTSILNGVCAVTHREA